MRTSYKFLRSLWPYVGPVLGVISLVALLDVTIEDIVVLYKWSAPRLLTLNLFLIFLIALFSFFSYVEFRHRNIPLTVISNEISLTLTSVSGDEATLVRIQKIRPATKLVAGLRSRGISDG